MSGKTSSFIIIHFGTYSDRSCRVHVTRVAIICPVRKFIDFYFTVPDLQMCNLFQQKSMLEYINMVMHKELVDMRACKDKRMPLVIRKS